MQLSAILSGYNTICKTAREICHIWLNVSLFFYGFFKVKETLMIPPSDEETSRE